MTTINSIANLLVNCGLTETEAFEMAEHEYNTAPTYTELAEMDAEEIERRASEEYDDWGYDYEEYEPVEDLYLDTVLRDLEDGVNVLIYLNSARVVFCCTDTEPLVLQDSIGNHTARNWRDGLNLIQTHHALDGRYNDTKYIVRALVKSDNKNVKVYLDVNRDTNDTVHELEYAGNLYARKSAFNY